MKSLTAKDPTYVFSRLFDLARAEPAAMGKHGRPAVVVMAVEEFERPKAREKEGSELGVKAVPKNPTRSSCIK
jgi:hypothetical protein